VPPGVYKITMTANGKPYTSTITVRPDPMGASMPPGATGLLAIDAAEGLDPASQEPITWPAKPVTPTATTNPSGRGGGRR
jgi:hypothetical protein